MSGGGGGVIIIKVIKHTLSNPIVHGQLPAQTVASLDPILSKDEGSWSYADKVLAGHAFVWALTNCQ